MPSVNGMVSISSRFNFKKMVLVSVTVKIVYEVKEVENVVRALLSKKDKDGTFGKVFKSWEFFFHR